MNNTYWERAQKVLPGGVNSPVRSFRSVGLDPKFIASAKGPMLYDVEGNAYIDYISGWGPMLFGHAHPAIEDAIAYALKSGVCFGATTVREVEVAELIVDMVPNIDMVRMVNSGTEAVMSALRLARGSTGRNKVIKFIGCYHGHADAMLVSAGSGALTLSIPNSGGVTAGQAKDTLLAVYNDIESVRALFEANANDIAAVVVEPVAGNMGVVLPNEGFLEGLRSLCDANGALLVFDEVITGFRLAKGGAQEYFGVRADIVVFGKIIGGGLPVGAYAAKREIMGNVAPLGDVYQAGTLSGNPLAMAAGLQQLTMIANDTELYTRLREKANKLAEGINEAIKEYDAPMCVNQIESMICPFFTRGPVTSYDQAMSSDTKLYAAYFKNMLEQGMYIAPAQFEVMFMSDAHSMDDIDITIIAIKKSLAAMKQGKIF